MHSSHVLAGSVASVASLAIACARPQPEAQPGALAPHVAPVAVYDLDVRIDPMPRSMTVAGTAVLPPATHTVRSLGFRLLTPLHDLRIEIVEPAAVAGTLVPAAIGACTWQCDYEAPLAGAIAAGQRLVIRFAYRAGDRTGFVFRIGGSDASFADATNTAWYPVFGPPVERDGKRWIDGDASMVGTVGLDVPRELTAIATGAELAVVERGDRKRYTYRVTQPSAGAFAVAKFSVLRSPGALPVSVYSLGGIEDPEAMLAGIRAVVDQLVAIYGRFPFPAFSLVEVSDAAADGTGFGGAGCAGFMLATTGYLSGGFNTALFGHEIGHQWWGNVVGHATERDGNFLLDEALAQYGSLYTVRHLEGEAAAERYRESGYPGYVASQSGGNYLAMSLAGIDARLGALPTDGQLGHELADEKGFLVFDMLREEIGEAAFHGALRDVIAAYAYRSITWREFQRAVERRAGRDLAWFWAQWFERLGAPMFEVTWSQRDGAVVGSITQHEPAYRLKLPIVVRDQAGGRDRRVVEVSRLATPFRFAHAAPVTAVDIDPQFETLHYTPELAAAARARVPDVVAAWQKMTAP